MRQLSILGWAALLFTLGCDPATNTLVGTWETNIHHSDGTRTQVITTFKADGTFFREVVHGPQANHQQVDQQSTQEGTWRASSGIVTMKLSSGTAWKDEIQTLEAKTLYLKCIEGADPVRRGEYAGSHRR